MSAVLEMLVGQAAGNGCDLVTIRALVEEAAEVGARRALEIQPSFMPARQVEAMTLCQGFIRQVLIRASMTEHLEASASWQRLTHFPVQSIDAVTLPDGTALETGNYAVDIDSAGDGWVRSVEGQALRVVYRAGLAEDFDGLPEPLKSGISRMANWLRENHDGSEPPAAVTALWRPYRRLRLS